MNDASNLTMEILEAAMLVTATTNHHVFTEYSGHVNGMSVNYYENGWSESGSAIWLIHATNDMDKLSNTLDKLISLLD